MKWLDIVSTGVLSGFALVLALIIVYSSFNGWQITMTFNEYKEGIVEIVILFFGALTSIYLILKRIKGG